MRSAAASAVDQFGKFLVDENAERLERPRRRMNLVRLGAHHPSDNVGQRLGGADRRKLPGRDDGAGDAARMALLAELENDVGEIALARLRHHVSSARPVGAHAHIKRTIEPEREAALGLVELHRGHAEIEHDAVHRRVAEFFRDAIERGEALLDQRESATGRLDQAGAIRHGALVAIDTDDLGVGGGEDRAGVAASTEGAVDVDAAVANIQELKRGPREHGHMTGRSASDSRAIAVHHHPRAPCGSSAALSKPGRFIAAHTATVAPVKRTPKCTGAPDSKLRPKRDIGLFLQSVTPAVWDYLAQHGCLGDRTGQARTVPAGEPNHPED